MLKGLVSKGFVGLLMINPISSHSVPTTMNRFVKQRTSMSDYFTAHALSLEL
jgi:hypothetical protein